MFPKTFRTIRTSLGPRWLTDEEGGLVGYSLDLIKDAFLQRAYQGLLARLPQNDPLGLTTAPPDALAAMGQDRRVYRGIFDTDAQYALKLRNWLVDRPTQGNPFTLLRQLHGYTGTANGVSFRTVDDSGNWYSRDANGNESALLAQANWNWDNRPAGTWSRFWVIIYPGTLWLNGPAWGAPGAWGDLGRTWGGTITGEQARTLQAIVNDYKPGGTTCVNIILAFDAASFNPATPEPDGNWGKLYKISGGVSVSSRLATARYIPGV